MSSFNLRGSLLDGYGAGEALNHWYQPEVETLQSGTSPDYAILNHESINVQPPHQGNFLNDYRTGEALDNGLGNNDDLGQQYFDQQEGGTSQFVTSPNHVKVNPGSLNVQPSQWAQQPDAPREGTSQFGTTPHHAKVNSRSMNVQTPQWAQQPGGTSQFGTTPHHATVNSRSMNVQPPQWAQQPGDTSQFGTTPYHATVNSRSMNVQPPQWAQQPGGSSQFGTAPHHSKVNSRSMNIQPPRWAQQPDTPGEGTSQFGTTPHHAKVNSRLMNVQPPHWTQQPGVVNNVNPSISIQMNSFPLAEPGTSQSSNITNADAEKRARIKQSGRKYLEKKEEKRENAEKVVEFAKQMNDLMEVNASLEKEGVKAKIKQKNDEQELRYFKEEVSRLNNKLKGQTMQVDVLSDNLVASPEVTDVAEENKQLKRKIELLTTATNNPDVITTVELQEENEKLKRELKKLRILNEALCDKMNKDEQ